MVVDGFNYNVKSLVDVAHQFFSRLQVGCQHFAQSSYKLFALFLYNCIVDFSFILEIGVDGAATLLRSVGNVVHSGIFDTLTSEQLSCYFNELFTSLDCHKYCTN